MCRDLVVNQLSSWGYSPYEWSNTHFPFLKSHGQNEQQSSASRSPSTSPLLPPRNKRLWLLFEHRAVGRLDERPTRPSHSAPVGSRCCQKANLKLASTQTNEQANKQTNEHAGKQADKPTGPPTRTNRRAPTQANKQADRQTGRQRDRETERQRDRETERQTDRQTNIHTYLYIM